ncbi:MAG: TonB-dependent receptor [Bacteroidetes bacterium]|nr:TonB-dependent receptor [Bacteroidota bacterium]
MKALPFRPVSAAAFLLLLTAVPLFPQQEGDSVKYQFDPVLVTGTTAKERETPVTFTNLHKGTIEQRYSMQDVPVMLSELPSMISYSDGGNGVGYNYVFLRGFDQRRLSIMVNGIPQNDPEDHNVYWIDFPDLLASSSNVQVQRGAGSAFYGPPAIGGSVNIITNPFTPKPYMKFEAMFGFQEYADSSQSLPMTMRKLSASFNSGLIDNTYMFYGRLGKVESNGYRIQSAFSAGSYFFGALRFDEGMTTRVHLFGGPLQDQLVYTGLPKWTNGNAKLRRMNLSYWEDDGKQFTFATQRRPQEKEGFNQPHYEILNDWKLSETEHLHNTLFYYDSHGYFDFDGSWVGKNFDTGVDSDTLAFAMGPYFSGRNLENEIIRAGVDLVQWGWLSRYELQHDRGELTIGAEYRHHWGSHWGKLQYAEGLPSGYDPDARFYQYDGIKHMASLYITESYKLQDDMTLMANLQFAFNEYQIRNEKIRGNSFAVPYLFVNPRLGLNYNITEEWNTYVSFGYTSREPRLRNLYAAEDAYFGALPAFEADTAGGVTRYDFSKPIATPEQLLNLELGAGYKESTLQLNANVYWMEFTDELVKSGQVDIFGNPVYGNAPRTRHIGAEFDGSVQFLDRIIISGNASFSLNSIVEFSTVDSASGGVTYRTTLDGNPIAGFPGVTANLRVTWQEQTASVSFVLKHVGSFYTDNFQNTANRNDAWTVLNFESLWTITEVSGAEIGLRGEVRNVLNALYMQTGEGNAFFPAAERNYLAGITVQW